MNIFFEILLKFFPFINLAAYPYKKCACRVNQDCSYTARNQCNAQRIRCHQLLYYWRLANQQRKIIGHRSRIHIHSDQTAPICNMMKLEKKASSSL
jgi:hypothetical protein